MTVDVAAAAIVRAGRVLAARRTEPPAFAGHWELPGGKVEPGETIAQAAVREVEEELGCRIVIEAGLGSPEPLSSGYRLNVVLARFGDAELVPQDHDLLRWLGPEELDDVAWLSGDLPFLPQLRQLLLDGERLAGGNVGATVRIGSTVRRPTGAWTAAVHRLLAGLAASGLDGVPRVLGVDERGREVLTFLSGRVPDVDAEVTSEAVLASAMRWLRRYHDTVEGVAYDGPWRTADRPLAPGELICHNDFAPYNVVLASSRVGEQVVGVFDWDMAGPGTRLDDLAFAACSWVPLIRPRAPRESAYRLRLMAHAYGDVSAEAILRAVPARVERSLEVIATGQRSGDPGMLNLAKVGEPARTARALQGIRERLPAILAATAAEGSDL